MSNRTKYLSRLMGLYYLIASLIMAIQKQTMLEIENTVIHNGAMLYILGILTMLGGLAIILAHHQWSGGALPVTVTLLGWITLIKGVLLAQPQAAMGLWTHLQYERFYYLYIGIAFAIGAGLAYGGFRQPPAAIDRRERPRVAA